MKPVWHEVTWKDAASREGWHDLQEARCTEPLLIVTVGKIIYRDKDHVVLCCSLGLSNQTYAGIWTIPRVWIHKIRRLK